jgi:DNA-binding Xre family transcriptional regulator
MVIFMMEQYNRILSAYKTWYPALYDKTLECRPSGRYRILVLLKDGTKMEFDSLDNSVRNVSRYYAKDDAEVDEEAWRKEFGRKLKQIMIDKGISQEGLADSVGISRQMMSRYVRGNSTPSGYILTRLVNVLGCDARELTKFGYIDEE